MVARFESLAQLAAVRSPANAGFFGFALDYARRHREVIEHSGDSPAEIRSWDARRREASSSFSS